MCLLDLGQHGGARPALHITELGAVRLPNVERRFPERGGGFFMRVSTAKKKTVTYRFDDQYVGHLKEMFGTDNPVQELMNSVSGYLSDGFDLKPEAPNEITDVTLHLVSKSRKNIRQEGSGATIKNVLNIFQVPTSSWTQKKTIAIRVLKIYHTQKFTNFIVGLCLRARMLRLWALCIFAKLSINHEHFVWITQCQMRSQKVLMEKTLAALEALMYRPAQSDYVVFGMLRVKTLDHV